MFSASWQCIIKAGGKVQVSWGRIHERLMANEELDVLPGKASTIINASLASFSRLKTEAIEKRKALSI